MPCLPRIFIGFICNTFSYALLSLFTAFYSGWIFKKWMNKFRNFNRQAFRMKTTSPKIIFMSPFFWQQQFILYFTVHHTACVFILRVLWAFIKDGSQRQELAAVNVDENVLCTWVLFCYLLRYCNKTRGRTGRGWGRRAMDFNVWKRWKVLEVKTGLKRWSGLVQCSFSPPSHNPAIDPAFLNEFFWAMWDFCLAIFHLLFFLDERCGAFPPSP